MQEVSFCCRGPVCFDIAADHQSALRRCHTYDFHIITGLGVLFGKLQQGVQENQQILTVARMRADAEEAYGQRLADIGPATDRFSGGFGRDDGASVRKVGY
jgi:hypothetical protein